MWRNLGSSQKTADSAVQRHQAYNDAMAKIDSYARKENVVSGKNLSGSRNGVLFSRGLVLHASKTLHMLNISGEVVFGFLHNFHVVHCASRNYTWKTKFFVCN